MEKAGKIGLFDSGLGGLTVLDALGKVLPNVSKIYYGDTLHLPYGDKSADAIIGYSMRIVTFLKEQGCELIVIACNSASAAAGTALEEAFPELRFVNVIDPVVESLAKGTHQHIGLLGTRATVRSGAYPERLHTLNPELRLESLSTPLLVPLIEDGFLGTGIDRSVLSHYLSHERLHGVQALVPGCTHYPLLKSLVRELKEEVQWVDAPAIVAEKVAALWANDRSLGTEETHGEVAYFLSDKTESFLELAQSTFGIHAAWETKVLP